ncbi:MAG TPA: SurA N-terminal domain-containing protein [Thermoanaerobaculia bacterium]|nr:SurA N-terminal domain-containing protein [Thermoanaerobaculia bacterium]
MLKTFRENFKHLKWVLWAVIAVFVIFVFADWGMGAAGGGGGGPDFAAKVGSSKITEVEFRREYVQAEERYRQMYGQSFSPELARAMNLPSQVLNSLVDRRLLRAETERLGLTVSDAEVTARILKMRDQQGNLIFVKDGAFVGEAIYRRMLAGANLSPEGFEADTREQALLEKLNRFVTESSFVGEDELKADFEGRTVKAKIAYALVPAPALSPEAISDAEAEARFKKSPTDYQLPERRKGKYLLVESAQLRAEVARKVTDADIAAEYSKNLDSYRKGEEVTVRHILYKADGTPAADAAARAKADSAVKRLKGGADFAALAKAESEDPGSKASGGELGGISRGRMVKEFEDAAFGAAQGDIVGPVKSPFGFHVLQVTGKGAERVQPLFEVSASIRARLEESRAGDEARRLARELADRVGKLGKKPTDDDLRKLTRPGVTFNETELLARADAPAGIGPNPSFMQLLFELPLGEVSDPVATARGEAILKPIEVKVAGPAAFADVKARVKADLVKMKQQETALAAARAAMTPGASLEAVAQAAGVKVEAPEAFPKAGPVPGLGTSKALLDAAFSATPGEMKGPVWVADRGAAVLRVQEVTPFDAEAFAKQKGEALDRLRQQKSGRLFQSLVQRLRAEARIEVNKELLARFSGQA